MSLIGSNVLTPAQDAKRQIIENMTNAYAILEGALRSSVATLYNDPTATQTILDEFGNDGLQLFQLSNIAVTALNAVTELTGVGTLIANVVPSSHSVAFDGNGKATDTYTAPSSSSSEEAPGGA